MYIYIYIHIVVYIYIYVYCHDSYIYIYIGPARPHRAVRCRPAGALGSERVFRSCNLRAAQWSKVDVLKSLMLHMNSECEFWQLCL